MSPRGDTPSGVELGPSVRADMLTILRSWSRRDRWHQVVLILMQVAASFLDLLGLAMLLPLMQALTEAHSRTGHLGTLSRLLGDPPRQQLVMQLAAAVMLAFILKTAASLTIQWWTLGFNSRVIAQTQQEVLRQYLSADYLTHKNRGTGEIVRALGQAVSDGVGRVVGGSATLVTQVLSVAVIMALLLATLPIPTIAAIGYFTVAMVLIDRLLVSPNKAAGRQANEAGARLSKAMLQAVGAFREVKMHDAEEHFLAIYSAANEEVRETGRRSNFLAQVPKQLLELLTICGMAIMLVVISQAMSDPQALIPSLTLFVAAAMKILPTLSGISATIGSINFGRAGLHITADILRQPVIGTDGARARNSVSRTADVSAHHETIRLTDVSFTYPGAESPVLCGVSLALEPGTSTAITGASGAGKTTLVDILLGLLTPTSGTVSHGQMRLDPGARAGWHALVAYVPQDVYLLDDTVIDNVAFGVAREQVDETLVWDVLRAVQLDSVVAALPEGLDASVGERGARLSGGQRQRIGIARALYRKPSVLVLDEATSALDNETELNVARALASLKGKVTTVVVAHRLSTVRDVDQLIHLRNGRIDAQGTFDEVRRQSEEFASLVKLGSLDGRAPHGHGAFEDR